MKFSKGSGGTWCRCMGDLQCHVKSFEKSIGEVWALFSSRGIAREATVCPRSLISNPAFSYRTFLSSSLRESPKYKRVKNGAALVGLGLKGLRLQIASASTLGSMQHN